MATTITVFLMFRRSALSIGLEILQIRSDQSVLYSALSAFLAVLLAITMTGSVMSSNQFVLTARVYISTYIVSYHLTIYNCFQYCTIVV